VTPPLSGLDDLKHVIVMDNFFPSIELFRDLERLGIYATRTIRPNRIGLLHVFKNLVAFKKKSVVQGTFKWRMGGRLAHQSPGGRSAPKPNVGTCHTTYSRSKRSRSISTSA
jgi:hypothetical protein